MTVHFYIEIFSGSGRLAHAISKCTGQLCLLWDISLGSNYDLTNRKNVQIIIDWIRAGIVIGCHLGTECKSFSRARDRPNGPPRLRSNEFPLGLPDIVNPGDRMKVQIGNILMRVSVRIFHTCLQHRTPVTLENLAGSRLRLCPGVQQLLRNKQCYLAT